MDITVKINSNEVVRQTIYIPRFKKFRENTWACIKNTTLHRIA